MAIRGSKGSKNIGGALAKIRDRTRGFDKLEVRIGVQENQQYKDGPPVAYVAAIHEYGAPEVGIPPRPFLRTTRDQKRKEWTDQMLDGVEAVMLGAVSVDQALEMIGMGAAGDVKKTISEIDSPPLKQATIDRKGHAKPLVETGLLLQSITSKVADKE